MIIPHKYGTLTIKDSSINGHEKLTSFFEIWLFTDIVLHKMEFTDIIQYKDACVKLDGLFGGESEKKPHAEYICNHCGRKYIFRTPIEMEDGPTIPEWKIMVESVRFDCKCSMTVFLVDVMIRLRKEGVDGDTSIPLEDLPA